MLEIAMFDQKKDLFHLYIYGERNRLKKLPDHFLFFKSFLKGLIWDILRIARITRNKYYRKPDLKDKVIIHVNTLNNLNALSFLRGRYPHAVWTSVSASIGYDEDIINIRNGYRSNSHFEKYIFLLFLYFNPKYGSKMIDLIKDNYYYFEFFRHVYQENKPKVVFISNDHTPSSRGLILVAREMGIQTIYFQHASVTEIFPPLRFKYSFLYGSHSHSMYKAIGEMEGEIFTVGNPIFDQYREAITEKRRSFNIGIAYNALDDMDGVEHLVYGLEKEVEDCAIWIRPHPDDGRKSRFTGRFGFSDSKSQSSREFLKEMDIVIAGNTSLLLEAACMNVLPLQYDFSKYAPYLRDYYRFIRNGLAVHCSNIEDVVEKVQCFYNQKDRNFRDRAILYDASIGSDYEFRVREKIFDILDKYSL